MSTLVRKPTAVRREEIAQAALRIIGEEGLPALTTNALADAVGLSSGALFRHFESRGAILEEAVAQAVAKLEATFPEAPQPPVERILTLARGRIALLSQEPGLAWLLRSEQAALVLPDPAVRRLEALADRTRGFLLEALREGIRAGAIRADRPPEHLLVIVIGTIHALIGAPSVQQSPRRMPGAHAEAVLATLRALLAPAAPPLEGDHP